ncbi:hypothetical protein AAVH_16392 [Aphelenchoides avenae]|nr:hypothetical protein AAVH_16392 [Aphelenchus avenae]
MNPESFLQVATVRLEADVDALLTSLSVHKNVLVGFRFEKTQANKAAQLKRECEKLDRRLDDAREKLEIVQSASLRMPQVAAIRKFLTQRRGTWKCVMPEEVLRDIAACVDNVSIAFVCGCMLKSSQAIFGGSSSSPTTGR